jgi:hypothetical protein
MTAATDFNHFEYLPSNASFSRHRTVPIPLSSYSNILIISIMAPFTTASFAPPDCAKPGHSPPGTCDI